MAMGSRVLYLIIFIVGQQSSLIGIARADFAPFDYFQLSLSWPAAVCNTDGRFCSRSSYPLPQYFTIHGLWPLRFNSSTPHDCYEPYYRYYPIQIRTPIREVSITRYQWIYYLIYLWANHLMVVGDDMDAGLLYYLNAHWPNLVGGPGSNQQNWGYQWNKHGRCGLIWFPQLQYFQAAVHHASLINIMEQFRVNRIYPGEYHRTEDIQAVVESLVRKHVVLWCTTDKAGNQQLTTIHFCYDPANNFDMFSCVDYYTPSCTKEEILFTSIGL